MRNPNIFITVKPSLIGFTDFYDIIKINLFLIVRLTRRYLCFLLAARTPKAHRSMNSAL